MLICAVRSFQNGVQKISQYYITEYALEAGTFIYIPEMMTMYEVGGGGGGGGGEGGEFAGFPTCTGSKLYYQLEATRDQLI